MDGNTRLCTATAGAALSETFGSDGQPGSYADLDATDRILLVGHNMAAQQTVLWCAHPRPAARARPAEARRHRPAADADRRGGRRPPRPRLGTNVAAPERPAEPDHRGRADRPRVHRRAHRRASTSWRETVAALPARAGRGDRRRPGRRPPRGGADPRRARSAGLDASSRASTSRTRRPPPPAR